MSLSHVVKKITRSRGSGGHFGRRDTRAAVSTARRGQPADRLVDAGGDRCRGREGGIEARPRRAPGRRVPVLNTRNGGADWPCGQEYRRLRGSGRRCKADSGAGWTEGRVGVRGKLGPGKMGPGRMGPGGLAPGGRRVGRGPRQKVSGPIRTRVVAGGDERRSQEEGWEWVWTEVCRRT